MKLGFSIDIKALELSVKVSTKAPRLTIDINIQREHWFRKINLSSNNKSRETKKIHSEYEIFELGIVQVAYSEEYQIPFGHMKIDKILTSPTQDHCEKAIMEVFL